MTDRSNRRVGMISLGCAKNLVDSEVMLGQLRSEGHEVVNDLERAETVIVNTCGFIDEAKEESIESILEVAARKAEGGVEKLLVAGCMVNRYGEELAEAIPEIDGFIGLDELRKAGQVVQLGGGPPPPSQTVPPGLRSFTEPRLLTTRGFAYLKVAEGCNNPCTFCAIPVWRGRFRSRTVESLVEEARQLRGGRDPGAVPDRPGHHPLRLRPGPGAPRPGPAWWRRCWSTPRSPGSASSTPIPTTLDEGAAAVDGSRRSASAPTSTCPLQHSHPEISARHEAGAAAPGATSS